MKTKMRRFSKRSLSTVLAFLMIFSTLMVGTITATDAAEVETVSTGADTSRTFFVGIPHSWDNKTNWSFGLYTSSSATSATASVNGSNATLVDENHEYWGEYFDIYALNISNTTAGYCDITRDGNKYCNSGGNRETIGTNNFIRFGWRWTAMYTYTLTSTTSLSASPSSVYVNETSTLTPSLSSNSTFNALDSTTYTVKWDNSGGAACTSGTDYTISDNVFTPLKQGTFYISASSGYHCKGFTAQSGTATSSATITVTGYYVASGTSNDGGSAAFSSTAWGASDSDALLTKTATNTYSKTFTNVAAGTYYYKVTHGTWNTSYPSSNQTITVPHTGDSVTITYNSSTHAVSDSVGHISYTVTLNKNGGTVNAGNVTSYTCGTGATLPTNVTKTGHTFDGWFDNSGLTGNAVTSIDTSATGNKEYWAKWTPNTYTITYKNGGNTAFDGTHGSGYPTGYTYGVGATLVAPSKTGYTFGGWFTSSDCSGSAVTSISTTATGNKTYYAKWTANVYTITYKDKDDASFSGTHGSGYPTTHTYGTETALVSPTRTGYTFNGWYTSSDCSGDAVTSLGATAYTGNITLYAKWTIKTYAITFTQTGAVSSGGTMKIDGTARSSGYAVTHGNHSFRVEAPTGYEISSITGIGTWTIDPDSEMFATLGSTSITSTKTITVTYKVSTNPVLRVDYTGSGGATTASSGSVTTTTRHNVTVTFTNQDVMTNGASYSVKYTKDGGAATTLVSGTTSTSGGEIVAKAAGTLSAGTYVYTVTVGTKSTSVTVVVNQSYNLVVKSVSHATVSGTYTNEFGQTSQSISAAGTYYAISGGAYSVTYTAATYYCLSSSNNNTTTKTYSGTVTADTNVTKPTSYEQKYTLTVEQSLDGATATGERSDTLKTVTGQGVTAPAPTGYTITGWTVTSGSVYINGVEKTNGTTINTAGNLSGVTLHAAATIQANYSDNSYTLTVNQKKGSAAATNQSSPTMHYNATGSYTAASVTGYKVDSWQVISGSLFVSGTEYTSGSGVQDVIDADTYTLSNITLHGAATIQFNYTENSHTLTLNKKLGSGSTTKIDDYTIHPVTGTNITAPTETYYTLSNYTVTTGPVTINGTSKATNATISAGNLTAVKASNDVVIRANFTENSYTLTINKKLGDAAAAGAGSQTVKPVTTSTVNYPSVTGYAIQGWTVTSGTVYINGEAHTAGESSASISTKGNLSNATIRGAATIQANFTENLYTVTVNAATQGSKALGTITAPAGGSGSTVTAGEDTKPTITAVAKTGYEFVNWTGSNLTFTNANAASTTVKATAAGTATANFKRTRVYMDTNSKWAIGTNNVDHFAAYFFWGANYANTEWVTMTAVDGVAGRYYADIPSAAITNGSYKVIFVALSNTTNAWGNKAYQTSDLTPCANGNTLKNLYTLGNESNNLYAATLEADAYFPPQTYSVTVNVNDSDMGSATTPINVVDDSDSTVYTTLTAPEANYGYKFTGWTVTTGTVKTSEGTFVAGTNPEFSTSATPAIQVTGAGTVIQANFTYNDEMHFRISGRLRAKDGSGNYIYTSGTSQTEWDADGTAEYMEFVYDSSKHSYFMDSNTTLADIAAYRYNSNVPYFRIYDVDNSKSWTPPSNVTFDDNNEGVNNKYEVSANGSNNFTFSSSQTNGPVRIWFDPINLKVWYTIPARHDASIGTISRTIRTTTTSVSNGIGGTININNGTDTISVSEGTNYEIKVTPVTGYKVTALAINGESIIGTHQDATSMFTIDRPMGEPAQEGDPYSETITVTFTAIPRNVTVGKNSSDSGNTVAFTVKNGNTVIHSNVTSATDVTIEDTITPVVSVNTSNGYEIYRIRLTSPTGTSAISGYSNLTNNSAINMLNQNVRVYVIFRAALPTITATNKNVTAGQPITIEGTTESWASFTSFQLKDNSGNNIGDAVSTDGTLVAPTENIDRTSGTNFKVTLTSTNDKSSDISSSTYNIKSATKTVTVHVSYSATQLKYLELQDQYTIYNGYQISSDMVKSGWSAYESALSAAGSATFPAWDATNTQDYQDLLDDLEDAYGDLEFNETTIYVLSKYEHSDTSYVNIFVFNNDNSDNHKPTPVFYSDTSLEAARINNADDTYHRHYHMTYEGRTNSGKHLYSFTYRGKQEFIIYRRSGSTSLMGENNTKKLTLDVDMLSKDYGEFYLDVKDYDLTANNPTATESNVSTFTDFNKQTYIRTGTIANDLVAICKEGDEGYSASWLATKFGISYRTASLIATSNQQVTERFIVNGPSTTNLVVEGSNNWVPTEPGPYTFSLTAILGTPNENNSNVRATFSLNKSSTFTLYVSYDEITVYADMNGNVGTPTIHFTYLDTTNNNEPTDLPYEFDMVTGSESIYSRKISVTTLKNAYNLDLIEGTVAGYSGNGIEIDHISIDSVTIDASNFVIDKQAARTGTLWLKADSTNMKTFNRIAYGSANRTFKAVLDDGTQTDEYGGTFARVSGTGIITDDLVGDSYEYNVFYAAKDTQADYNFSYNVRAVADTDISHTVGNTTSYYYFDHWELEGDNTHAVVSVSNETDININSAPVYSDEGSDITYVAVYKLIPATNYQKRVKITYNFKDYDTSDGNYIYDKPYTGVIADDLSEKVVDASYTKTVKWDGSTPLATLAQTSYASVKINSNYFDYTFNPSTAAVTTTQAEDSHTKITCISATLEYKPHLYRIVFNGTTYYRDYYMRSKELSKTGSNIRWYLDGPNSSKIVVGTGNSYTAKFGLYQTSGTEGSFKYDSYALNTESVASSTDLTSNIITAHQEVYNDGNTQKARHNFYIIDTTANDETFVGGGVVYATATTGSAYNEGYRQTAAGTNLASTSSIRDYIGGILTNKAKCETEFKAQTINNTGFRYLPYEKGTDIFRYSSVLGAFQYMFAGENTNSSSLSGQDLRVFSYFIYTTSSPTENTIFTEDGTSYNVIVSSTYAETSRYIAN